MVAFVSTQLVLRSTVWAQGAVSAKNRDAVEVAQELFDDQRYEESIQSLSATLVRPGQSVERRILIYRLLALNYITLNRKDEAESSARGVFALSPNYELPKSESPKFREFFVEAKRRWDADGRPGAAPEKIVLRHQVPMEIPARKTFDISTMVEANKNAVAGVKVFYRTRGQEAFAELDATMTGSQAVASVPADAVRGPLLEYYIQAVDKKGHVVGIRGEATEPLRVTVNEPSSGSKAWVPIVIVGSVLVVAGLVVGGLAVGGVFKSKPQPPPNPAPEEKRSVVKVVVGGASIPVAPGLSF
jgi:hypothetical protein